MPRRASCQAASQPARPPPTIVTREATILAIIGCGGAGRSGRGGPLRFGVETPDLGEATEEIEVDYSGDPLEIGFNASYLLEVLRYMPTSEVKLAFKAPERAATIEPTSKDGEERPDYLCLVMPLRLLE